MKRGRFVRWILAVVLLVAAVAHVLFWYGARPRAGELRGDGLAGALLTSGSYDSALWVPYPHQNLGALHESVVDSEAYLESLARVLGVDRLELPRFGPFAAPPASELTLASDRDGSRFSVAARVYPSMAWISRLAGKVASNPWMSGGSVRVDGRPAQVRWEGRLWILEAGGDAPPSPGSSGATTAAGSGSALARLILRRPLDRMPAGSYRLLRRPEGLELVPAAGAPPAWSGAARLRQAEAVALAVEGRGPGLRATALFGGAAPEGGVRSSDLAAHLPGLAAYAAPGVRRHRLPGEKFFKLLRGDLASSVVGEWSIVTLEDATQRQALALAPELDRLRDLGPGAGNPALGLWVRPAEARRWTAKIAGVLDKVPIIGKREAEEWHDWTTLLAPFEPFEQLVLATGSEPNAFALRLLTAAPAD